MSREQGCTCGPIPVYCPIHDARSAEYARLPERGPSDTAPWSEAEHKRQHQLRMQEEDNL